MLLPDSLLSSSADNIIITIRLYEMRIVDKPERQKYVKGS